MRQISSFAGGVESLELQEVSPRIDLHPLVLILQYYDSSDASLDIKPHTVSFVAVF